MLQTRNMAANEDTSQSRVPDARRETTLAGESCAPCPNCGTRIQRRDLYKHFAACPKRQYTCDFCNFVSTYDVVLNHWQNECNRTVSLQLQTGAYRAPEFGRARERMPPCECNGRLRIRRVQSSPTTQRHATPPQRERGRAPSSSG